MTDLAEPRRSGNPGVQEPVGGCVTGVGPQTDFAAWDHTVLARLTQELWEENKTLRLDNKLLLEQWRKSVNDTK